MDTIPLWLTHRIYAAPNVFAFVARRATITAVGCCLDRVPKKGEQP
jgi:hypothetical protein